jgi:hypothetical protein
VKTEEEEEEEEEEGGGGGGGGGGREGGRKKIEMAGPKFSRMSTHSTKPTAGEVRVQHQLGVSFPE